MEAGGWIAVLDQQGWCLLCVSAFSGPHSRASHHHPGGELQGPGGCSLFGGWGPRWGIFTPVEGRKSKSPAELLCRLLCLSNLRECSLMAFIWSCQRQSLHTSYFHGAALWWLGTSWACLHMGKCDSLTPWWGAEHGPAEMSSCIRF